MRRRREDVVVDCAESDEILRNEDVVLDCAVIPSPPVLTLFDDDDVEFVAPLPVAVVEDEAALVAELVVVDETMLDGP